MMKRLMLGAAVLGLSLVAAPRAHAQAGVGVSAGLSMPTGDFGKSFKSGYSVNGLFGVAMPMSPIGFRGEVGYNSWDGKSGVASGVTASSLSGTANIVLQVPGMIAAKPYVIGGLGYHRLKVDAGTLSDTQSKMGWNLGGGLNFGLGTLSTMLEARYVTVNTQGGSTHYVPITFGIMF
ncbi:MAG TPA: outer membrane beta-barrel protein [Gemmatimonadaceae bacterium]|nr:outer membrane beta-barrel protein [Gemmatimonadaceae bacterium]